MLRSGGSMCIRAVAMSRGLDFGYLPPSTTATFGGSASISEEHRHVLAATEFPLLPPRRAPQPMELRFLRVGLRPIPRGHH